MRLVLAPCRGFESRAFRGEPCFGMRLEGLDVDAALLAAVACRERGREGRLRVLASTTHGRLDAATGDAPHEDPGGRAVREGSRCDGAASCHRVTLGAAHARAQESTRRSRSAGRNRTGPSGPPSRTHGSRPSCAAAYTQARETPSSTCTSAGFSRGFTCSNPDRCGQVIACAWARVHESASQTPVCLSRRCACRSEKLGG